MFIRIIHRMNDAGRRTSQSEFKGGEVVGREPWDGSLASAVAGLRDAAEHLARCTAALLGGATP